MEYHNKKYISNLFLTTVLEIPRKAGVNEFSKSPTNIDRLSMTKTPPGECRYTPRTGVTSIMNARVDIRKKPDFEIIIMTT